MDAVRIAFVRSIFLLPRDDAGNAAARDALMDFIVGSAAAPVPQFDLERLETYLTQVLQKRGLPETDPEPSIIELASIARRAAGGGALFAPSHAHRHVG